MVGTQDFKTWIDAESGWKVDSVSQYFPNHGRNYGLFQFAQIHPWTDNYLNGETSWTARRLHAGQARRAILRALEAGGHPQLRRADP